MWTLRIPLLLLCIATSALVAKAGDTNSTKAVWPIDSLNFKVLEYTFSPATQKITVHFMDPNSSIVYSGIKVKPEGSDIRFTVLSMLGGADAQNDPMFKDAKGGGWLVSFDAPGFDPKKAKLIYQGEAAGDTRIIPHRSQ